MMIMTVIAIITLLTIKQTVCEFAWLSIFDIIIALIAKEFFSGRPALI